MGTLPEGRKPLDDDWFNMWPNVDDFSQPPIRKEKKDENANDTPTTSE